MLCIFIRLRELRSLIISFKVLKAYMLRYVTTTILYTLASTRYINAKSTVLLFGQINRILKVKLHKNYNKKLKHVCDYVVFALLFPEEVSLQWYTYFSSNLKTIRVL